MGDCSEIVTPVTSSFFRFNVFISTPLPLLLPLPLPLPLPRVSTRKFAVLCVFLPPLPLPSPPPFFIFIYLFIFFFVSSCMFINLSIVSSSNLSAFYVHLHCSRRQLHVSPLVSINFPLLRIHPCITILSVLVSVFVSMFNFHCVSNATTRR